MADRMGLLLTVEGFSEYKQVALQVQKINDGVAQSMQDVEGASGPAQTGVKQLATAFAVGNVAAGIFMKGLNMATSMAKKLIVGSTMLAARVKVLGTVLEGVGERAGYTATQMQELEATVKAQGITTQAARQSLIMMAQANVDLAYATDLSRVAQNAAVVAGTNSSDAFQRLIYGMSRGRTQVLATMGIIVNFVKAEDQLAKSLNKTRKELDPTERMQARYTAVLEASTAIQDAYTDAMQDAGKQMTSIPRYLEEIQLAMGDAFQPAFTTLIFELKERLGELLDFLKDPDTKQALDDFGKMLDKTLKLLLEVADKSAVELPKIAKHFRVAAIAISDMVWPLETAIQTVDDLGESARQFFAMFWGATVATLEGLKQLVVQVVNLADVFVKAGDVMRAMVARDPEWIARSVAALTSSKEAFWDWSENAEEAVNTAFAEATAAAGRYVEVLDEAAMTQQEWLQQLRNARADIVNAKTAVEELGEAVIGLSDDMVDASEAVVELRLRLQRDYADQLIRQERATIKREIGLARDREDLARRNAERVADAYQRAEEARANLQEDTTERIADFEQDAADDRKDIDLDYARTRIDIELATRRRLEDIQRDFEFSLLDAARTRDAFALVMAQRRAAREREEALKGRGRQLEDAKTDHTQQREDLKRSLVEQRADLQVSLAERQQDIERQLHESLVAIEEQRREDLANMARRNAREQEMRNLQTQWEEEDRRRRLARQLEDIERQYGVLLGVTAEGLLEQVEEWELAFGADGAATRIVRGFSEMAQREAESVRLATVRMANEWLDTMRLMSQVSPVGIPLPPELQFQSPKLGLQVGLEKLQAYLKDQPLNIMAGGAMPATRSSMFSRSESFSRTESSHDVNVNMPNTDAVVASQMTTMFKQVLAA